MAAQHIHIIGIGGSGASGVARYLQGIGFAITGSDLEAPRTLELKQLGIQVFDTHDAANIGRPDMVLFSPGIFAAEKELAAAKNKGIPILSWQEFIGRYLSRRPGKGFMVAGTYGKGSTAAILSHILAAAYLDPLAILGLEDIAWDSNLRLGFGEFWVMEADEYNRHFHFFQPAYACLTSLEHEHVSTYPTFDAYKQGFKQFFAAMNPPKIVVAKRTPNIDAAIKSLVASPVVTYSLTGEADVRGRVIKAGVEGSRFEVEAPIFNVAKRELEIGVPGMIHVENALGAVAMTLAAGIEMNAVNAGLATFKGLRRRFEVVTNRSFVTVFDYAHTPDRIRAVMDEARRLYPRRRLVVLFEPHLFSRTQQLLAGFRAILSTADRAYVTDIYPSREAHSKLQAEIHSRDIAAGGDDRIIYAGSLTEGITAVKQARTERDVVLVLGAGPIQYAASQLT